MGKLKDCCNISFVAGAGQEGAGKKPGGGAAIGGEGVGTWSLVDKDVRL